MPGISRIIHHSQIKPWTDDIRENLLPESQYSCEPLEDLKLLLKKLPGSIKLQMVTQLLPYPTISYATLQRADSPDMYRSLSMSSLVNSMPHLQKALRQHLLHPDREQENEILTTASPPLIKK